MLLSKRFLDFADPTYLAQTLKLAQDCLQSRFAGLIVHYFSAIRVSLFGQQINETYLSFWIL